MSKLELGLGLEVLGFRTAPPLGKTTKGEEYKTQEPFCLVNVGFFLFFYIVFFFLFFFCFAFIAFTIACSSPCIAAACCGMLLFALCCC